MIIVKLQGGMGNQLFQYAMARSIQKKINCGMILDTSDYKFDKAGREYALGCLNIPQAITCDDTGKYNWIYDQRTNWLIKFGVKIAPNILYKLLMTFNIYVWEEIKYKNINVKDKNKNIYLHGLWQSELYFRDIEEDIKEEFKVITDISDQEKGLMLLMNTENSVCIHVRRGDFLSKNNSLHVCSLDYYYQAIQIMNSKIKTPHYYVFSDDIEYIKDNLIFSDNEVTYVDGINNDYEEFRLMYNCKNFIISNSTFSWWASYLGGKGKIVVAPRIWYEDATDISALIRDEMICI